MFGCLISSRYSCARRVRAFHRQARDVWACLPPWPSGRPAQISRRDTVGAGSRGRGGAVGLPRFDCGCPERPRPLPAALEVLRKSISVDGPHTWWNHRESPLKAPPNDDLAKGMTAGSLAVACLADVPDGPILKRNEAGVLTAGTPQPGQLYQYHLGRLDWVDEMIAHHGLRRALSAADLEAAHAAGNPAIVGDVEGLDFLEGKLERLEEVHQRGVRHVQLVHYTPNEIGDSQTGTVTHHGLTSLARK